ncbi:MAG: 4Fe-4S binding protein [Candidatus Cloacimonadota bacterium]|nr:4Fe-4S binding protein [Candidatus Cloacimonadota bacterium]
MRKSYGKNQNRKYIQLGILGISFIFFLLLIRGVLASAHAYCPYSLVCFGTWNIFTKGVPFIFSIAIIFGILILVSSIFLGRWFCGYACPIGTIQELVYSTKHTKKKFNQLIPYKIHKYLNIIKYVILIFTIVAAILSSQALYMKFCPILAIAHPQTITIAGIISLLIIVVGGYFVERFWCRYICPFAALMNLMQKFADFLKIKRYKIFRNIHTSLNCFNCPNYCPMYIDIGDNEKINSPNCIKCFKCVRLCSTEDPKNSTCIYRD